MKLFLFLAIFTLSFHAHSLETITVYGASDVRNDCENPTVMDALICKFNSEFAVEYGFKVNYQTKVNELKEAYKKGPSQLAAEEVDLVEVKDIVDLGFTRKHNFFEPVNSSIINKNIPQHLRASDGAWFAVSKRVRAIYHHESVDPSEVSTYESLTNPKWNGQLCLRQASKTYNKALVAFFFETRGDDETLDLIEGWMRNNPNITTKDMEHKNSRYMGTIEAVDKGKCLVGVANTYYMGFYEWRYPNRKIPVKISIPENAHINMKAIGLLKTSKKKAMAQKYMEWLSLAKTQEFDSFNSNNFPTNPKAKLKGFLARVGSVDAKENKTLDFERVSFVKEEAHQYMNALGWDDNATVLKSAEEAQSK